VVPAVCATYLVNSMLAKFLVGWGIATLASVLSLVVTAKEDLPIGAAFKWSRDMVEFAPTTLYIPRFLPGTADMDFMSATL